MTQSDSVGGAKAANDEHTTTTGTETNHLFSAINSTCIRLQGGYFSDPNSQRHREARASLAELRRYSSLDIKGNPLALSNALFVLREDFSEKLAGKGDEPSASEHAAYVALTLFAQHMQSASQPVHVRNVSFAQACGILHAQSTSNSIKPRFDAMLLAGSESARLVHIRSLISLMRAKSLSFDYGWFASDLRSLTSPQKRSGVQLRWGRDFARGSFSKISTSDLS